MKSIALLSPHLDDAVFSVGGLMAALADEGHELHVVTCFTRSMPNPTGFALACQLDKGLSAEVDYMQMRRKEDARACALLNAQPHWINLPEAPHRGYHSAAALFGEFVEADTVQPELQEQLVQAVEKIKPNLVLSPVGVGNHVDHRQVRQVVDWLAGRFPSVSFLRWYDEPYLSRHPEQYPERVTAEQEPGWEVLRQRMTRADDTAVCLNVGDYTDRKMAACAAYTTQVGFQFGGAALIQKSLERQGRLTELLV